MSSSDAQQEEALKVCENFIVGMLKTFGTLPQERIHSMLTNYVENYSLSIPELVNFLGKLVKEDKIESKAGLFNLKK